jgi:RNA polymerase sigma factor (TIGR02999 family)
MPDVTLLLNSVGSGDPDAAAQLLQLVYDDLRRLAAHRLAHEAPGQTLEPTALVHEACLRLVGEAPDRQWDGPGHFFAAAEAMRRILVENARSERRLKRGGERTRLPLEEAELLAPEPREDVPALDEALGLGTPVAVPLINTLNEVTSSHTARLAGWRDHLPMSIVALLFLAAFVAILLMGSQQGTSGEWHPGAMLGFIALVSLVVLVTLDLNQPHRGLITVSQEPMRRVLSGMGR